jgi:tRNA nucleotidyltransferase (CCA-adding enzyme)
LPSPTPGASNARDHPGSNLAADVQRFLVGGAVRDLLLGLEPRERDWLVTGASAETLLAQGFRQVGKAFAVFLDPQHGEQHALPRGGAVDHPLEDDLERRDLTINAMAMDARGRLIDPLGGSADLQRRVLRHTPHFEQDPLRVLRLARFAARYHALGFHIAPETTALARSMARAGRLQDLSPERVWTEIARALAEPHARMFFETLRSLEALAAVLPELDALFGVPQPARYHPEIDAGEHTLMVLAQACQLTPDPRIRFAALTHDLGKGSSPKAIWPSHRGHEQRGVEILGSLCRRLPVPREWEELARLVVRHHGLFHRLGELRPATVLALLEASDAFRRPERLQAFAIACEADARGRAGLERQPVPQRELLLRLFEAARGVDTSALARGLADGRRIAEAIHAARLSAIRRTLSQSRC